MGQVRKQPTWSQIRERSVVHASLGLKVAIPELMYWSGVPGVDESPWDPWAFHLDHVAQDWRHAL